MSVELDAGWLVNSISQKCHHHELSDPDHRSSKLVKELQWGVFLFCFSLLSLHPVEGHFISHDFDLKCYSQILCGGSAEKFRFWLFCIDLVAN